MRSAVGGCAKDTGDNMNTDELMRNMREGQNRESRGLPDPSNSVLSNVSGTSRLASSWNSIDT